MESEAIHSQEDQKSNPLEQSKKQKQVAAIVQSEFSNVLLQEGSFIYGVEPLVTVTNVRMSADLGIAYIYVSVYNAPYKQEVVKELWENLAYLRGLLGKRIRKQVRRIPRIKFFIDDTLDEVEHIDHLFNQLNSRKDSVRSMKDSLDKKDYQDKYFEEE